MKDHMHILVAVDGSETARRAAAFAGEIAASTHSSIELLFVTSFQDGKVTGKERFIPVQVLVSGMQSPDDVFAKARKNIPTDVAVSVHTRTGLPAPHILAFAKERESDLIVVGSKGVSAVEGFLIGSVSQKVLEDAACPVLIVK